MMTDKCAPLILQEPEVVERVAVDHQDVREGALGDHPELALGPHDFGVGSSGRDYDLVRGQHLGADQELARLILLGGAQEVGSQAHAHAGLLADLDRA